MKKLKEILHAKRTVTEKHIKQLHKEGKQGNRYTIMMPDIPFLVLGLLCDIGWLVYLIAGFLYFFNNGSYYLIDFMNVCRGRWEYDVARTYFLLKEFSDNLADSLGEISISDLYLEQMNVKYRDIEQWVEIVAEYRRYE